MTADPPGEQQFELTLLGPGYGESIVIHIGDGAWVVVDSCAGAEGVPGAIGYLRSIGVDPTEAVVLIVATHWHDDHIRGMAHLVETCRNARFCCAAALCAEEFLALVRALEGHHLSAGGSGVRELHRVFSHLTDAGKTPLHAVANRVVCQRDSCKIWSLSPGDDTFRRFLRAVGDLIPGRGENKTRIGSLSPNEAAVVIWIEAAGFALLLGADLERRGWVAIVESEARPAGRASVFKVPHHGSRNAHEAEVWARMLEDEPLAVLTPWRRGGKRLPDTRDVERISSITPNAWITDRGLGQTNARHRNRAVERTLRESGIRRQRLAREVGMVRLRRPIGASSRWTVDTFGSACRLADYAA